MIGLSNAPLPTPQITFAPSIPLSIPSDWHGQFYDSDIRAFTDEAKQNNSLTTLRFPLDTPKYIMTFTFSQYSRSSLTSVGEFQEAGKGYPGIMLPFPEQMIDLDSTNWSEEALGWSTGSAINAATAKGVTADQRAAGLAAVAAGAVSGFTGIGAGVISAAEQLASPLLSTIGIAPNEFLTLLFKGPKYKRHKFAWTLAPNNFAEAEVLRAMIQTFRNASAPGIFASLANAPVLWTYPKIVYVRLYPNSKFMYKFKPCIIDNIAVNYTPGNKFAALRNGTGIIGDNPPTCIQLQIELIELEFWTAGNYDSTNAPNNVYPTEALTGQQLAVSQTVQELVGSITGALSNLAIPFKPPI